MQSPLDSPRDSIPSSPLRRQDGAQNLEVGRARVRGRHITVVTQGFNKKAGDCAQNALKTEPAFFSRENKAFFLNKDFAIRSRRRRQREELSQDTITILEEGSGLKALRKCDNIANQFFDASEDPSMFAAQVSAAPEKIANAAPFFVVGSAVVGCLSSLSALVSHTKRRLRDLPRLEKKLQALHQEIQSTYKNSSLESRLVDFSRAKDTGFQKNFQDLLYGEQSLEDFDSYLASFKTKENIRNILVARSKELASSPEKKELKEIIAALDSPLAYKDPRKLLDPLLEGDTLSNEQKKELKEELGHHDFEKTFKNALKDSGIASLLEKKDRTLMAKQRMKGILKEFSAAQWLGEAVAASFTFIGGCMDLSAKFSSLENFVSVGNSIVAPLGEAAAGAASMTIGGAIAGFAFAAAQMVSIRRESRKLFRAKAELKDLEGEKTRLEATLKTDRGKLTPQERRQIEKDLLALDDVIGKVNEAVDLAKRNMKRAALDFLVGAATGVAGLGAMFSLFSNPVGLGIVGAALGLSLAYRSGLLQLALSKAQPVFESVHKSCQRIAKNCLTQKPLEIQDIHPIKRAISLTGQEGQELGIDFSNYFPANLPSVNSLRSQTAFRLIS